MRGWCFAALCLPLLLWSAPAVAGMPDGRWPAIAVPGGGLHVEALESGGAVRLEGEVAVDLATEWMHSPADGSRARCVLPADMPAGRYDLVVGEERRIGAVFVREAVGDSYALAVVAGASEPDLARAIAGAQGAEAIALVFIASGRVETGGPMAMAAREAGLPVYLIGPDARVDAPYPFGAGIGEDIVLFHDPRASRLGASDGALHRLRRATRASRWSIAVWPEYDPLIGMRSQLVLFADDPVDLFVSTLEQIPASVADAAFPGFWPRVRFEPLAAGRADSMIVVQVGPATLHSARVPLGGSAGGEE